MNHYTLAEMTPGLTEEFTVTVTPEMMDAFRAITGDVSPHPHRRRLRPGTRLPGAGRLRDAGRELFSLRWRASICPASTACSTAWSANLPSRFSSATR